MAPGRFGKRALALVALAPAFGGIGVAAAVAYAVWFELPSGVAAQNYVSLGRQAALSGRVGGLAEVVVAEIRERVPEARWLTVERLGWMPVETDLEGGEASLWTEGVSGGFFEVLGMVAAHGELAAPPDTPALVLDYETWQRLFAGEDVAGRLLAVRGEGPLTVAGVAPPRFRGLLADPTQLWVLNPRRLPSVVAQGDLRGRFWQYIYNRHVFGILDPGTSLAKLEGLLADLRLYREPPSGGRVLTMTADDRLTITPGLTGAPTVRQTVEARTRWLVAIVVCLLVLAFATLVDLLLADQSARDEERRVRVAVGATPGQLYRQCLVENAAFAAALAVLAGAAGAYLGHVLLGVQPFARWLVELSPGAIVVGGAVGLVALVLAHAVAAGCAMRTVAAASTSLAASWRPRKSAAARRLLLLAATGSLLLVGSVALRYWREAGFAFGFAHQHTLLMQAWSSECTRDTEAIRRAILALPEVRRTARMDLLPFIGPTSIANRARIAGRADFDGVTVLYGGVKPAYFETLGVPVLAGRPHRGSGEVVVSRALARRLGGLEEDLAAALGQAVRIQREARDAAESDVVSTVVGVVEDIPYGEYLDGERTAVYGDTAGSPWDQRWAIHHDGDADALVAALRQAETFAGCEIVHIGSPRSLFEMQFMAQRGVEILLAGAAALAFALALAGLAGSQFRRLAEDRRAIGVGLALGATTGALAGRYLRPLLADLVVAAAVPGVALVALGAALPTAMAGATAMLATELVAPALVVVAAVASGIVWLATGRTVAANSPASLMRAG